MTRDPRINVTTYSERKHTIREAIALIWKLAREATR